MHKQKVIIRVDGNNEIGLGHISRCCALADMLKSNFVIQFHTRADSKPLLNNMRQYCEDVIVLKGDTSYDEEAATWISAFSGNEIVVLDGYNFTTIYQKKIKEKGCRLVCIDDIHAYHFVADAVINHAPGINKKKYLIEPYTRLYLGTNYILLKKIFLDAAAQKPVIKDLKESPVLICFGGADPNDITMQTLEQTMCLFQQRKLNVVVGAAYKYLNSLVRLAQTRSHIELHQNIQPEGMLKLMQQSHAAIISASTTALEYICVKGNLYLKQTADNQKEIYDSLIETKCAYPFENIKTKCLSTDITSNQYKLIDGQSAKRILKIFNELAAN